jgi:16S rRNA (uracil1498-N3)-methyltransferase
MHRFYLSPSECQDTTLTLAGTEAHHALHVLRVARGERVVVLDGAGHELLCEIRDTSRGEVSLAVQQRNRLAVLPYRLTLIQAVTKAKSMEIIVQKATELGAARLVPVLSERSVAQLEAEAAERKTEKWRSIAIEAIKQCGSPWLPEIEEPLKAGAWLARNEKFDLALVASLQPGSRHPREILQNYQAEHGRAPRQIAVWVGPEGDFTPAELGAICGAGAQPITLGPLVLRSETAAIYCLSFLSYELQSSRVENPA